MADELSPTPWHVQKGLQKSLNGEDYFIHCVTDRNGDIIAKISGKNCEADARMMAGAPRLLEQLDRVMRGPVFAHAKHIIEDAKRAG